MSDYYVAPLFRLAPANMGGCGFHSVRQNTITLKLNREGQHATEGEWRLNCSANMRVTIEGWLTPGLYNRLGPKRRGSHCSQVQRESTTC